MVARQEVFWDSSLKLNVIIGENRSVSLLVGVN